MPINVEGPGGESIEFPDGTDHDTILTAMKKHFGGPAPQTSALKEFGKGMGRTLTDIGGSIADVATLRPLREDVSRLTHRLSGEEAADPKGIGTENAAAMNKKLGLEQAPDATLGQRIAGGVGEAMTNPLSLAGAGSLPLKAAGAVFGPAGAETARTVAEGMGAPGWVQGAAGMAGGAAGGSVTGATSKALRQRAGRKALAGPDAVEAGSKAGYKVIENDPTLIPTHETDALHSTLDTWLDSHARDDINSPMTYKYMERYLKDRDQPARYKDLMNLHSKLATVPADERIAGQLVRDEIVDYMQRRDPKINSTLKAAINDWNVKSQVEELQKVKEAGKNQAGVTGWGGNTQNAELQGLNRILKNDKRLSRLNPEEQQALQDVVRGTFMSRGSRWVDKAVPHGLLPLIGMASFPAAVGLAGAKTAFRKLGEHLTDQQIQSLIGKVQERATINKTQAAKNAAMRQDASKSLRDQTLRSAVVGGQNAVNDQLNDAQPQ